MSPVSFASDNHTGVHPQILQALVACNQGTAASYEMDELSQKLKKDLKNILGCEESFIVFNGTAANVLALNTAVRSFESIICTDISHLHVDECGAPEKFIGAKLITIPHKDGKLPLSELENFVIRKGDQHFSQVKAISITQPTEYGTVYSLEELQALRDFCDKEKLYLHIDGARLGNAVHYLHTTFKKILSYADVASVGGAKNGLLVGELVAIINPALKENFKYFRKQAMQLPSKTRFLAAQFATYFENNLWKDIAAKQCEMAQYLGAQLTSLGIPLHFAVESNAVFCVIPKDIIKSLRQDFFFYVWNEKTYECRLMTAFDTQKEDLDRFITQLKQLMR